MKSKFYSINYKFMFLSLINHPTDYHYKLYMNYNYDQNVYDSLLQVVCYQCAIKSCFSYNKNFVL